MDIMELRLEALKLARSRHGGDMLPADLLVSEADKLAKFIEDGGPLISFEAPALTEKEKQRMGDRLAHLGKPGRKYLKSKAALFMKDRDTTSAASRRQAR